MKLIGRGFTLLQRCWRTQKSSSTRRFWVTTASPQYSEYIFIPRQTDTCDTGASCPAWTPHACNLCILASPKPVEGSKRWTVCYRFVQSSTEKATLALVSPWQKQGKSAWVDFCTLLCSLIMGEVPGLEQTWLYPPWIAMGIYPGCCGWSKKLLSVVQSSFMKLCELNRLFS